MREHTDDGAAGVRPRVQSVARAVQMVDLVARSERGLSAKQISALTGVNRSATYHLLYTLTQTDVLSRDGSRYLMGPRAGVFAAGTGRHRPHRDQVTASVQALERATGQTVVVAAWGQPGITVVGRTGTPVIARELSPGFARWGHARASGKLLLALGSERDRERFLATHRLEARTANTIDDRRRLVRELDKIRERGYAVDDEEFLPGISCLAGALHTVRGKLALCVVAPTARFRADVDLFAAELRRVVDGFDPAPLTLAQ